MTDGWWARKLGQVPTSPQSYPQIPQGYPQSYAPVTVPTVDLAGHQNPPPVMIEDTTVPGGRRLNWRSWGGGEAARTETERCPNCGSPNYFHFHQEAKFTERGAFHPAPQCFECNYNGGLFKVFGGG